MEWSDAALLADEGLKIVDNVLSFAKTGVGNPGKREQSLFLSATAMAYAVWENYVEQVSIELVEVIADQIDPALVPERPKAELSRKDAWDLTVHPGWRVLWVELVRTRAIGSEIGASDYGLNTANTSQVTKLFDLVGVEAFKGMDPGVTANLDKLVSARGAIVHTAQPPSSKFKKADATGWRDFVKDLYEGFDQSLQRETSTLIGQQPW